MEPMERIFVITALTLMFVIISINPMEAAIQEAVDTNAYLQARRISTVTNLVASGPDGISYTMDMPGQNCRLLITPSFVKLEITGIKKTSEIYGLVTPNGIQHNFQFDCSSKKIKITKTNGAVIFSEV